jgi:hypothetical protein
MDNKGNIYRSDTIPDYGIPLNEEQAEILESLTQSEREALYPIMKTNNDWKITLGIGKSKQKRYNRNIKKNV